MIYVFFADGFEEIEALTPVDVLRRAGLDVLTVGVTGKTVTGSHGIPVVCDAQIDDVNPVDIEAVVLPGGLPGTTNLEKCDRVQEFIDCANSEGKIVAAICAAPSVLGHKGLLEGKRATCYTGFEKDLVGAVCTGEPAVRDGNIVTGRGAGAAFEFAFTLLDALTGSSTQSEKLRAGMLCVK